MKNFTYEILKKTTAKIDILNITDAVLEKLKNSKVRDGIAVVHIPGSTASISTIEYEDGVIFDLKKRLEEIIPQNIIYKHDLKWGDGNGYSHVGACLLGPSVSIPITNGELALGAWQQIVLIDFDNSPRSRRILVQILGS